MSKQLSPKDLEERLTKEWCEYMGVKSMNEFPEYQGVFELRPLTRHD